MNWFQIYCLVLRSVNRTNINFAQWYVTERLAMHRLCNWTGTVSMAISTCFMDRYIWTCHVAYGYRLDLSFKYFLQIKWVKNILYRANIEASGYGSFSYILADIPAVFSSYVSHLIIADIICLLLRLFAQVLCCSRFAKLILIATSNR